MAGNRALHRLAAATADEGAQGRGVERREIVGEVGGADHFALVHRDAAQHLRAIFGEEQLGEQCLYLAEAALGVETGRPAGDFAQHFGIGGEPAKAVDDMLLDIGEDAIDLAVRIADPRLHMRAGGGGEGVGGIGRTGQQRRQIGQDQDILVHLHGRAHPSPARFLFADAIALASRPPTRLPVIS